MKGKRKVIIIISFLVCLALAFGGFMLFTKHQMSKLPELSFKETLEYTTKGKANAVISIGIIKDGEVSYNVYGENGKELENELHTYEIGSLTKTVTAGLINKAVQEGKITLESTIDKYLDLPDGNTYPTIEELLTHTSGYKSHYFEKPIVANFFKGRNDFYGITKEMTLERLGKVSVDKESYRFKYSNFGFATLGLVLEAVYDTDYAILCNDFLQNELGLKNTKISDMNGDLGKYWDWNKTDAYLSAGAITSDISDMLKYAQLQLNDSNIFSDCHNSLKKINGTTEAYKAMGICMDEIGMSWIIDTENDIIWHNGGTSNYNSYLGFNPKTKTAVVILSNFSPVYKIPATVMGVKLLEELHKPTV